MWFNIVRCRKRNVSVSPSPFVFDTVWRNLILRSEIRSAAQQDQIDLACLIIITVQKQKEKKKEGKNQWQLLGYIFFLVHFSCYMQKFYLFTHYILPYYLQVYHDCADERASLTDIHPEPLNHLPRQRSHRIRLR